RPACVDESPVLFDPGQVDGGQVAAAGAVGGPDLAVADRAGDVAVAVGAAGPVHGGPLGRVPVPGMPVVGVAPGGGGVTIQGGDARVGALALQAGAGVVGLVGVAVGDVLVGVVDHVYSCSSSGCLSRSGRYPLASGSCPSSGMSTYGSFGSTCDTS